MYNVTMSLIETETPKRNKNYNPNIQDHGTSGTENGHRFKPHRWNKNFNQGPKATADKEHLRLNFEEMTDQDLESLSSKQLSAMADEILGETPINLNSDPVYSLSSELIKITEDTPDATEAQELVDQYSELYETREVLLSKIEEAPFDEASRLSDEVTVLNGKLSTIEAQVYEISDNQNRFPSEAELGVKSKRQIRKALAEQATGYLDPDDDNGDSDFNSPMRIRNRL